jgi:NADPH:quinone reductase-like Zn-dependent oxidoreductase
MKAWYIESYGGPDRLRRGDLPEPEMLPDDVLIEVRAASVNPIDWKMRSGMTRMILKQGFPLILGNDLAGVVVAVGDRAEGFAIGDQVFARPNKYRIGAFAKRIAVRADEVAHKPVGIDFVEAASLPLVGLTAIQGLSELAGLAAGQKVLIHAGAGGVGTFAIQYAKHLGAQVATTASAAKHELLRSLGADQVIDYRDQDFSTVLSGCDAVLDTVGGETLARSVRVLKPGGIIVSVSGPPGPEFAREWKLNAPLRLMVGLMSFGIRHRARAAGGGYRFFFMRASGEQLRTIAALVEQGAVRPVIDRVFGFENTREALAYAEAGHATGKVVIRGLSGP